MSMSENSYKENGVTIEEKYHLEREKRFHNGGLSQYMTIEEAPSKFHSFQEDPWLDPQRVSDSFRSIIVSHQAGKSQTKSLSDSGVQKTKVLIQGCGFGGLLAGIHLIETNRFKPKDVVFVDNACGWGGTWYWNRFPGVMCDVESYIYLPLLEEMEYIPKHKYSYGEEIREYTEMMAKRWGLYDRAVWRTSLGGLKWNDESREWVAELSTRVRDGEDNREIKSNLRAQFVYAGTGSFNVPHLPRIPNIEDYSGQAFHTARWNFSITGGSQSNPSLHNLKTKSVGIIGTGATAVQAVPELAKWSGHLYVFQRTPSQVDIRGQHITDAGWFKSNVATTRGWQRLRTENFCAFMMNKHPQPVVNLVHDAWTNMASYRARSGGYDEVTLAKVGEYLEKLHAEDLPRSDRIRARVSEIVKDRQTAESLKAWYPGWCKRPAFHDDYLPTFNLPNVTLVDTDGRGIEGMTSRGPTVAGTEYPVDVLIFSTGFVSPTVGSVASRAGISVIGRGGKHYDKKIEERGVTTLHGVVSRDFPNLFFPGPYQAGFSANQTFLLNQMARHAAYMIGEAIKRAEKEGGHVDCVTVEPYEEAEEEWSMKVAGTAFKMAPLIGCTPSYITAEGEIEKPIPGIDPVKGARRSVWGKGVIDFVEFLEHWRTEGDMKGLEVSY
ncbi:hypothetical protein GYMLUDRAFT_89093 [Collybiopsis luxurians FD-317 M1]|uniref:L-ornithine N(5)-oxygenase n=1 Tax=Collybiopsis luxurians FD-317 M1 TaxID=944289 RepID=A0A0D0C0V7_9AGAR|nr:hypothetical protein GYMLUDRAFT_89093 [Collybiopsis luxurians FD-317 M1]